MTEVVKEYASGVISVVTGFLITSLFAVSGFLFRNKLKDIDSRFKKIDDWHEKASIAHGEFLQVKTRLDKISEDYAEIITKQASILSQQDRILSSVEDIHKSLIRTNNKERRN